MEPKKNNAANATSRRHVLPIAFTAAAVALATACVPVEEGDMRREESDGEVGQSSAALATADHAFAVVEADGSLDPMGQYNSAGGAITAEARSTGIYRVYFHGLGDHSHTGNVQIVARGNDAARCKTNRFGTIDGNLEVHVLCHLPSGSTVDSGFVVQFNRPTGTATGEGALVHANQPFRDAYGVVSEFTWNSTGSTNRIVRSGVGVYNVLLGGLAEFAGNAQVTTFGTSHDFCMVNPTGTAPDPACGGDQRLEVRCFDTSGAPIDTKFLLSYLARDNVNINERGAYAWANDPAASSYALPGAYSYNSTASCGGTTDTATRASTGSYGIQHHALGADDGVPLVTATFSASTQAPEPKYCKLAGWTDSASGTDVQVRCFSADGTPADTSYGETFVSALAGPCGS